MIKLILLYTTFVFGLLFMVIPRTDNPIDLFLFSDMKLYPSTYVYFICERVTLIILAYILTAEERQYKQQVKVFFFLMCADLVDFMLSYNSPWTHIGVVPVSMNTISALVFGLVILHAWKKSIGSQYFG